MKFLGKLGLMLLICFCLQNIGAYQISPPTLAAEMVTAKSSKAAHDETYNNLLKAISTYQSTASFPSSRISYKNVGPIINEVISDHPEIFYLKQDGIRIYSNGKIELKYKYPVKTIQEMVKQQEAKITDIIKTTIKPGSSDFDKVMAIHDYFVLHTAYDWTNFQKGTVPDLSFTAYGVLMNGVAVCDGYSKAMKLLLERAGIEAHYVAGKGNGGDHSWNLVKVNGEYFYIDTTWDDPVPNRAGQVSYKYFLVPASYLKKDHAWNEKLLPTAKNTRYSYFQEFWAVKEVGNYYYYSNSLDEQKLYRIGKDGTGKTKILDERAPYFVVANKSIYFSNYSYGGYLFRASIAGTEVQQLNNIHSIDLSVEGSKLIYTNKSTGAKGKLDI